jgi:hypothetical protein
VPTHGPCTVGVALTELELSRGLPDPRKPISLRPQGPRVINLVFTVRQKALGAARVVWLTHGIN